MASNDLNFLTNGTFNLPPLFCKIPKKGFFYNEVLIKDILSLTLILECKNKNQPSGPIELDLEAGNLVQFKIVKA